MSNTKDVYRTNEAYRQLSEDDKVNIALMAQALKRSKVVKMCKDQFTLKRRIPFAFGSTDCQLSMACVLFANIKVEGDSETKTLTIDELAPFFSKYGLKWLKIKPKAD